MRMIVLVGVVLFGCERGPKASAECAPSAATFVKTLRLKSTVPADELKVKDLVAKHCVDDHWLVEAQRCVGSAATAEDRLTCEDKQLTGEQREKLHASLEPFEESESAVIFTAMRHFADMMCACKDAKCAEAVSDEMTKWTKDRMREGNGPPKLTDEETKKAAEMGEEMGKCMQAAMGANVAPDPAVAEAMAAMESFKDKMCKCKDKRCAQALSDEMMKWSKEQAKKHEMPKLSEDDAKKAAVLGEAMGECMQKAMAH